MPVQAHTVEDATDVTDATEKADDKRAKPKASEVSPLDAEEEDDDDAEEYKAPSFPVKSKPWSKFTVVGEKTKTTSHAVMRVIEIDEETKEAHEFIFKVTTERAAEPEAVAGACFKIIAPRHVSDTYAVYKEVDWKFMGVASEEIPDFKGLDEDPLRADDLDTSFIEKKGLTIELLEKLDDQFYEMRKENLKHLRQEKYKQGSREKIDMSAAERRLDEFYAEILNKHNITKKEFTNYCIKKGLAICLATSLFLMEDDLHQRNFSKFGMRVDYDMSLFPYLYDYKDGKLVWFRKPKEETFKVTASDLAKFPNVKHSGFYWVTKKTVVPVAEEFGWMSANSFSQQARELFQQLGFPKRIIREEKESKAEKQMDVFQYHTFATWIRCILTQKSAYSKAADQRMCKDFSRGSESFAHVFAVGLGARSEEYKNALAQLPEFVSFFMRKGEEIKNKLLADLAEQGLKDEQGNINKRYIELAEFYSSKKFTITSYTVFKKASQGDFQVSSACIEVKAHIVGAMNCYINPGLPGMYGALRNHSDFATFLSKKATGWDVRKLSEKSNFEMIANYVKDISDKLTALECGEMFDVLTKLLENINKSLTRYELQVAKQQVMTP